MVFHILSLQEVLGKFSHVQILLETFRLHFSYCFSCVPLLDVVVTKQAQFRLCGSLFLASLE